MTLFIFINGIVWRMIWRIPFHKAIINILKDSFQEEKIDKLKILDFGSGNSTRFANDYIDLNITSLDIIAPCVTSHLKYQQYDGNNIPFSDKYFDVVIASFVLHHISRQDFVLHELCRVSKYVIILEDIPEYSWFPYLSYQFCRSHYKFFNQDEKEYMNHIKTEKSWIELIKPYAYLINKEYIHSDITYGFVPHVIFLWKWK